MDPQIEAPSRPIGVLVVDDDDRVRRLCVRSLRNSGFHVLEAGEGQEAIEVASQHALEIDVVVTDIVMPGIDGIELVTRLRAVHPTLAIVLMSGYAPAEVFRRNTFASTFPLLKKPFVIDQLCQKVREAIGSA